MKQKVNQQTVIWALIFAIGFPLSVFVLSKYSLSAPISILIIGLNSLLFGIYSIKLIRSISVLDEVQIRIQLEAVSIAFILSLLMTMILGLAGLVKNLGFDDINFLYIFPLLFMFYLIGLFISKRKYR